MARKGDATHESRRNTDPESEAKKRLRSLALSRGILRQSPANPSATLRPSNALLKLDGRDIVKRGHRRSRYLFSFPGLLAPLSSGRIGELADLGTRNPLLYLEFPQGWMKLFGTHVYPKNKYLTLQLSKSAKGVMCEDCFESMIVFADAWWIGTKEENPEECQLEFPKSLLLDTHVDYDFKGGAGASLDEKPGGNHSGAKHEVPFSLPIEVDDDASEKSHSEDENPTKIVLNSTPVRQSGSTAGRSLKYAESSSGGDAIDDEAEDDSSELDASGYTASKLEIYNTKIEAAETCEKSELCKTSAEKAKKKGKLVQSTLSSSFEKTLEKNSKRKETASPQRVSRSKRPKLDAEKNSTESRKSFLPSYFRWDNPKILQSPSTIGVELRGSNSRSLSLRWKMMKWKKYPVKLRILTAMKTGWNDNVDSKIYVF